MHTRAVMFAVGAPGCVAGEHEDRIRPDLTVGGLYIGAAFFAVGAPAALVVRLGVGWGKAGVTWQCQ